MGRTIDQTGTVDGFERSDQMKADAEARAKAGQRVFPAVLIPSARAVLVERNNPDEFLEFHWNPDSYSIQKVANWTATKVDGGTDILNYGGCGLTKISFEAFFNDLGQPADRQPQRSTEESISWLHRRLRPRTEYEASLRRSDQRRGLDWLQVRDPAAKKEPPVLILFGLRGPFECVLKSAPVTTVFQRGRSLPATAQTSADLNSTFGRRLIIPDARTQELNRQAGGEITRARVQITLWEYTNDPKAKKG